MKIILFAKIRLILCLTILIFFTNTLIAQELKTFPEIPGRTPSNKYQCRVRMVGSGEWVDAFVLQTISKPEIKINGNNSNGYLNQLKAWSASWIAFEFENTPVEVEISKVGGIAIKKAMVRPVGAASEAKIVDGKVYVTLDKTANINVDIDGQMEDKYTGMGYGGPAIHTISIFANPIYKVPSLSNSKVIALNPGEPIPTENTWDTIYFKPGIHRIGTPYIIPAGKALFIPGNAVVHGTIHPSTGWGQSAANNWSVYGSGTLSGEDIAWDINTSDNKPFTYSSEGVRLEGFVLADPAHHSFNMGCSSSNPKLANIYKNIKILGWRLNGDGINAFGNSTISDCFLRTQDDVFYYGGTNVKISNCVTWNDYNGSVLFVTKGAAVQEDSYFKDIKVIYHRAGWHYWDGGRVISFRDRKPGDIIKNVQIKNVLIEDPFPAFPPFFLKMVNPENSSKLCLFQNIIIEDVVQNSPAVNSSSDNSFGKPRNTMLGLDERRKLTNITFKNCYYNGKWLTSFEEGDFLKNDFINNIVFLVNFNVSVLVNDAKGGTASGGGVFNYGESVTVSASPAAGYQFKGWMMNDQTVSDNPEYTFIVNQDQEIMANFELISNTVQNSDMPFRIYPNPASDMLMISFPKIPVSKIQIIDLTGKVVYTNNAVQQDGKISLSGLINGLYFVKIDTNETIYTSKVIVRK